MRYAWLLLIPLGLLVFHNLSRAGFVGDDYDQVLYNQVIQSLSHPERFFTGSTFNSGGASELRGTYYKPMMTTVFALIYAVFGPSAPWFHVIQFLLGILNAILLYSFLRTMFREEISLLGAAFFLVHPVNSEALQYISNYQDTLFMTFGLAALNLEAWKFRYAFIPKFLLLMAAGLSKETGLLFIPILFAYAWLAKSQRRWLLLATCVASYSLLRIYVAGVSDLHSNYTPMETASTAVRLMNVPACVFYYLKNFFIPWPLGLAQHWIYREFSVQGVVVPLLGMAAALAFAWASIKKFGKPAWVFAIWSVLAVGLHSQLMPLDATVADRWHYLPSVGFLGLILLWVNEQWPEKNRIIAGVAALWIAAFAIFTHIRNGDWENEEKLLTRDLKYQPESFAIMSQLGFIMLGQNRWQEACPLLRKSVELAPAWWINTNNLGVCMFMEGDIEGAKAQFRRAIENGQYHLAYENYAKALLNQRRFKEAQDFLEDALRQFPQNQVLPGLLATARSASN